MGLAAVRMAFEKVKTPCVGICSTGIGDNVCRGCKRYGHEVIHWNSYTEDEKSLVEGRLVALLTQIVSNKINIFDEGLMMCQLKVQPVDLPAHRNLFCQAYVMIKAGVSQIRDSKAFGFTVMPEFQGLSLANICRDIDQEFYLLSQAHFDRCYSVKR